MPFARMFNNPNITKEQYDATRERMGVSQANMPNGGLIHFAGEGPGGDWRVVEVWNRKRTPTLGMRSLSRTSRRKASPGPRRRPGRCITSSSAERRSCEVAAEATGACVSVRDCPPG